VIFTGQKLAESHQGFKDGRRAGTLAGLKKAIDTSLIFTVDNGADTADTVLVTPDTVQASPT